MFDTGIIFINVFLLIVGLYAVTLIIYIVLAYLTAWIKKKIYQNIAKKVKQDFQDNYPRLEKYIIEDLMYGIKINEKKNEDS